MEFSERLQEMMDEKGFTKYRVSKKLGMSATTIANYLNSKTRPDNTKLEALSFLLGVNRNWLLKGEGDKERLNAMSGESQFGTGEDDSRMSVKLLSIVDRQTNSLSAKDEQIGKLIEINGRLIDKLTPLVEKLIEKL